MFDLSLGAMTIWEGGPSGPMLLVSSGLYGGLSTWAVTAQGDLVLRETQAFPNAAFALGQDTLVIARSQGWTIAFHGREAQHFVGYQLLADGTLGQIRRAAFDHASARIAAGDAGLLQVWAMLHDIAPPTVYGPSAGWQMTRGAVPLPDGSLLLAGTQSTALDWTDPTGQVRPYGMDLGLAAPTGLAHLPDMGAGARVVLAGGLSSSLSVFQAQGQGYIARDHVIDTTSTAFRHVQALSAAQVPTARGPLDLVLAGGGDHGITLFALTPAGRLIWLDTFFDTSATGLHNVTALVGIVQDTRLVVLATSERDAGISVLHLPLTNMGGLVLDGQGGAGDDILLAAAGVTTLTGGAGADIFVIPALAETVVITDFTPGQDRIDLSDWPMLRDMGQLVITPRADGAQISYREHGLTVRSATGVPLDGAALFPAGLQGPDRLLLSALPSPPALSDPPDPPLSPVPPPEIPALPLLCTAATVRSLVARDLSAASLPAAPGSRGPMPPLATDWSLEEIEQVWDALGLSDQTAEHPAPRAASDWASDWAAEWAAGADLVTLISRDVLDFF